jgi:hypothetical protein
MAAFNILAQWTLEVDDHDMVPLSIAALSLYNTNTFYY